MDWNWIKELERRRKMKNKTKMYIAKLMEKNKGQRQAWRRVIKNVYMQMK